jgi:uncharacterized membrane protein
MKVDIKPSEFTKTTIIGGVVVVAPIAIIIMAFNWLFELITDSIQPITDIITPLGVSELLADLLVLVGIALVCFKIGLLMKTKMGVWIYHSFETTVLSNIPLFSTVKEIVSQFSGNKQSPFERVAMARIFQNRTMSTVFITDETNSTYTVFQPTGPNPTSGNIYHLNKVYVTPIDIPIETAMRSIISCGAGSKEVLAAYEKAKPFQ